MEPPTSLDADALRDEKLKVLKALKPITPDTVDAVTVRGQYRAGASAGGAVKGYLDELGREDSTTETFVAVKAEVQNWRWAGVPFYLRTGKRMATRLSEIVVSFRPIPHSIFPASAGAVHHNRLVMRLQPDEGVRLWLMIKDPGPGGMRLQHVPLDMTFADAFGVKAPDAYERLLMDVVRARRRCSCGATRWTRRGPGSTPSSMRGRPPSRRPSPTRPAPGAPRRRGADRARRADVAGRRVLRGARGGRETGEVR